jgi:hypothetical protein
MATKIEKMSAGVYELKQKYLPKTPIPMIITANRTILVYCFLSHGKMMGAMIR